jgi:hypothetical protein
MNRTLIISLLIMADRQGYTYHSRAVKKNAPEPIFSYLLQDIPNTYSCLLI